MRPVSKTILHLYRQYCKRMARYGLKTRTLVEFADQQRHENKVRQERFRDKHEFKNAYNCWVGQREERRGVRFEDFVKFSKAAKRDEYGRILPHHPANKELSRKMLGTL